MEFTKPTANLVGFLRNKIHRNAFQYGVWRYRDRPATGEFNTEFKAPKDLVIWTTTAQNEEEEKRTMWLGTVIGVPREGWWNKYSAELRLGPLENQRLVFWATLRAGPGSIPMLAVVLGVLPDMWTPDQSIKMYNLAERNPEKRKLMSPSELAANTISQKMVDYYGNIGVHSLLAAHHGLVEMHKELV